MVRDGLPRHVVRCPAGVVEVVSADGRGRALLVAGRERAEESGVAVLLLHGVGCTAAALVPIARILNDLLPDGVGLASLDTRERIPGDCHVKLSGFSEGTRSVARELFGPARFVLAGHSFGASVGIRWTLDHPSEVAGLTLLSPAAAPEHVTPLFRLLAASAVAVPSRVARAVAHGLAAIPRGRAARRESVPFWFRLALWPIGPFPSFTQDSWRALLTSALVLGPCHLRAMKLVCTGNMMPELGRIACPVTIVHGTRDRVLSLRGAQEIAKRIPGSELVTLEREGHMFPFSLAAQAAHHIAATFARAAKA